MKAVSLAELICILPPCQCATLGHECDSCYVAGEAEALAVEMEPACPWMRVEGPVNIDNSTLCEVWTEWGDRAFAFHHRKYGWIGRLVGRIDGVTHYRLAGPGPEDEHDGNK